MPRNPVWNVYDSLRTAKLNVKYYGIKLHRLKQNNFYFEIAIALATSSTFAGLWLWQSGPGKKAWGLIALLAAILAVIKPLLKWADKIRAYSELLNGYRTYDHELIVIREMISQKLVYDQVLMDEYSKALQLKGSLVVKDPESKQDSGLIEKLMNEVNKELPVSSFYIPQ